MPQHSSRKTEFTYARFELLSFFFRAGAIRNFFGKAIKSKTLPATFNGTSVSNMTTHATRVRIAILKVRKLLLLNILSF